MSHLNSFQLKYDRTNQRKESVAEGGVLFVMKVGSLSKGFDFVHFEVTYRTIDQSPFTFVMLVPALSKRQALAQVDNFICQVK